MAMLATLKGVMMFLAIIALLVFILVCGEIAIMILAQIMSGARRGFKKGMEEKQDRNGGNNISFRW